MLSGLIERRYFFFPVREMEGTPSNWGLSYEDVSFPAADGVGLHGWYLPGPTETTVLWLHGNGGNISHRLENLMLVHRYLGAGIFIFDYRGYGRSQGRPSEVGTYQDSQGALDYLRSRPDVDADRIVYFGRSLGTAVAVWLATQHPPRGLILESPFSSVQDMARKVCPRLPLHRLVRNKYDTLSRIREVSCPVLIVHGEHDPLVPLEQGRKLFDAAEEPKRFHLIMGAAHNDTYQVGGEPYFRVLEEFLSSLGSDRR